MSERPSPERTAAIRTALSDLADDATAYLTRLYPAPISGEPFRSSMARVNDAYSNGLRAVDELVSALAAETARADVWERAHGDEKEISEHVCGDLRARLEQTREALQRIADEDAEEDYDPPVFADVLRVPAGTFRSPAVARAALAALQEAPPERHECMRCGSDEWAWCDYRGCSDCFEPEPVTVQEAPPNGEAT